MPSLRHLSVVLALALCAPLSAHAIEFSAEELARAKALQQRLVTLDSHLDTPANFGRTGFDIEQRHDRNALRRWTTRAWSKARSMAASGRSTPTRAIAAPPPTWPSVTTACSD
jgi:hypothetical protein